MKEILAEFDQEVRKAPEKTESILCKKINSLLNLIKAESIKDLTPTGVIKHKIVLINPTTKPIKQKMRVIPYSMKKLLLDILNEQTSAGLINPSDSPWSFQLKLVVKEDGSLRTTVDYRPLNDITRKDAHPGQIVDDLLFRLFKSKYKTKMDCLSGYYQVQLEEDSRQYTAFSFEYGHF